MLRHCVEAARRREEIKERFTTVKQVFFSYITEGSLVDTRAYKPYILAGPPLRRLVLDPLAVYTLTTIRDIFLITRLIETKHSPSTFPKKNKPILVKNVHAHTNTFKGSA